jgi:hypothetical protein
MDNILVLKDKSMINSRLPNNKYLPNAKYNSSLFAKYQNYNGM